MQAHTLAALLERHSDLAHTLPHDWLTLVRTPLGAADEEAAETMFVALRRLLHAAARFQRCAVLEQIDSGAVDLVSLIVPTLRLRLALNALRLRILDGGLFAAPSPTVARVFAETAALVEAQTPSVAQIDAFEAALGTVRARRPVFGAAAMYINELGAICFRRANEPLLRARVAAGTPRDPTSVLFGFAAAYGVGMLLWFLTRQTEIMHSVFNGINLHFTSADPSVLLANVAARVARADETTRTAYARLIDSDVAAYNADLFVFSVARDTYELAFRRLARLVGAEPGRTLLALAEQPYAAYQLLAMGALFVLGTAPTSEAEANARHSLSRRSVRERAVHRLLDVRVAHTLRDETDRARDGDTSSSSSSDDE